MIAGRVYSNRQKRGTGVRRRVAPTIANWKDFLCVDKKLFSFLAHVTGFSTEEGKDAFTTHGSDVLNSLVVADLT